MKQGRWARIMDGTCWAVLMIGSFVSAVRSAPLPPVGKADIDGVIETARWEPAKKLKAIRGMSGSAGRDRTLPAHLVVVLKNFSGPTARQAAMMNSFVGASQADANRTAMPSRLTVWINGDEPGQLRAGMRIHIGSYTVSGDEGGTWAHHDAVQILAVSSSKPARK